MDEESGAGRLDFQKHRRLQHATLDPRLDLLAKISTVKQVDKWYGDLNDYGATKLYEKLVPRELGLRAYRDRTMMGLWLSSISCKLRYLLGHISEVVDVRKEKIIVFTNRPLTLFHVECFLVNHGYHVLSIRSAHTTSEREAARDRFNDRRDPA